jgi:hypothetical protein
MGWKKKRSDEEIIHQLREAEVALAQGRTTKMETGSVAGGRSGSTAVAVGRGGAVRTAARVPGLGVHEPPTRIENAVPLEVTGIEFTGERKRKGGRSRGVGELLSCAAGLQRRTARPFEGGSRSRQATTARPCSGSFRLREVPDRPRVVASPAPIARAALFSAWATRPGATSWSRPSAPRHPRSTSSRASVR